MGQPASASASSTATASSSTTATAASSTTSATSASSYLAAYCDTDTRAAHVGPNRATHSRTGSRWDSHGRPDGRADVRPADV